MSRRSTPLLLVNTGHGKGKSSSSFGVLNRAWHQGWRCGVYQFVKSGKWKIGERVAAETLSASEVGGLLEVTAGPRPPVSDGEPVDGAADLAREGWEEVKRRIADESYDFLLLDEFTYPMTFGWVDTAEVIEVLRTRPGHQHVFITGRDAPAELVELADLVSEVTKVKHPFDAGIKAQPGIEW